MRREDETRENALDTALAAQLDALCALDARELTARRYEKYRRV